MYFCNMIFRHLLNMLSHPTWVRGLKQTFCCHWLTTLSSHPTWVRGLKRIRITETRIRTMFY